MDDGKTERAKNKEREKGHPFPAFPFRSTFALGYFRVDCCSGASHSVESEFAVSLVRLSMASSKYKVVYRSCIRRTMLASIMLLLFLGGSWVEEEKAESRLYASRDRGLSDLRRISYRFTLHDNLMLSWQWNLHSAGSFGCYQRNKGKG